MKKNYCQLIHAATIPAGLLAVTLVFSFAGCATAPEAPRPQVSISTKVPVVTAIVDDAAATGATGAGVRRTPEAQEKGGVEIAMVPVSYRAVRKDKVTFAAASPNFGTSLALSLDKSNAGKIFVQEITEANLLTDPEYLTFSVRVNNKLSRVFRGQGAVVQFNVANKLIPFGETDYKEFLNGIVPPRNENTFFIRGPRLDSLPDEGRIGIFLYDVVTATDVAGNVTEKQNYEWYFTYTMRTDTQTGERKVTQFLMDPAAYHARIARDEYEKKLAEMKAASGR